jgi:crotonobetaine/carnitine-CoA ligase
MDDSAAMPGRDACVVGPLLERWARERPERPFLEFEDGGAWSFREMRLRTRRAAAGLHALGLRRGARLLSWMPNRRETVLGWFGSNWLGAVYVPINTAWRGSLLQHAISLSQAELMIVDAAWLPRLLELDWPRLRREQGVTLRDLIVVGDFAAEGSGAGAGPGETLTSRSGLRLHRQDVLEGRAELAADAAVQPWDTNWILFTSGTTGPSKAVLGTYVQAWAGGAMAMDYFGPDDRLLANLPLFHVSGAGAVMDRLTKGGSCVLVDGFSATAFWELVRRFGISGCCLVGAMTQFLLKQPPDPRDRDHPLRNVITVPWNADSLAVGTRYGIRMHTAFNMTETATPIRSPPDPAQLGSCGRPRPGVEARVVDANDLEVAPGETGELVLRTSRPWEITAGYFRDPEATARAWRNGWFHTGDAFRRDAEGWFYFVDRLKDAIRRRGENISSFEVESEVGRHEAVREAAAIPVPSELGEDEVMVVLALQPGRTLDPLDLLRFLEPRMAHYMLPRYLRIVDALPKTPTAKVEKHRLRAEGVTPDTWDREAHGVTVRHGRLLLHG